jgi:hypothetical protein
MTRKTVAFLIGRRVRLGRPVASAQSQDCLNIPAGQSQLGFTAHGRRTPRARRPLTEIAFTMEVETSWR